MPVPPLPPSPEGNRGSLDGAERVGQPRGGWDRARWLWGTIGPLWHIVALSLPRRAGAGLRCQRFLGRSVVPSGAGGDWCGSSGRTLLSPAGEGTRTGRSADGRVWAAEKNAGLLLIPGKRRRVSVLGRCRSLVSPNLCPQSHLPSVLWPGGSSGPLLAPNFTTQRGLWGLALPGLPPKPSGVTPRVSPTCAGGSRPLSPPGGAGQEQQPPPDLRGSDFPPRRSGSGAQGASRSRRRKWLIVSPAEKNQRPKKRP